MHSPPLYTFFDQNNPWVIGISLFCSIAGLLFGLIQIKKRKRTIQEITWASLEADVSTLSRKIQRDFIPEIIVTPGLRGATIINILSQHFNPATLFIVGHTYLKNEVSEEKIKKNLLNNHFCIETTKYLVFFSNELINEQYNTCSILIVDDMVTTGDFLMSLKLKLKQEKFDDKKIKTMSVVTTESAVRSNKGPDFYVRTTMQFEYYFPWGRNK